jgi:hypothetical protein
MLLTLFWCQSAFWWTKALGLPAGYLIRSEDSNHPILGDSMFNNTYMYVNQASYFLFLFSFSPRHLGPELETPSI